MASVGARKFHSSYKHSYNKRRSCARNNISLDSSRVSIRMSDANSYETIPSPSSIASTSTIERSPKYRHRILSSTLKSKQLFLLFFCFVLFKNRKKIFFYF